MSTTQEKIAVMQPLLESVLKRAQEWQKEIGLEVRSERKSYAEGAMRVSLAIADDLRNAMFAPEPTKPTPKTYERVDMEQQENGLHTVTGRIFNAQKGYADVMYEKLRKCLFSEECPPLPHLSKGEDGKARNEA